ncbi:hypothetical protein BD779DRAFT_1547696 [Infundibulicybe gibba]|nr:hypothetical protein BD779DRAFT_1547696 [Infundibulicybe gibba]
MCPASLRLGPPPIRSRPKYPATFLLLLLTPPSGFPANVTFREAGKTVRLNGPDTRLVHLEVKTCPGSLSIFSFGCVTTVSPRIRLIHAIRYCR